jgi:isopropylmalate/homocitrate/citramalate synthase
VSEAFGKQRQISSLDAARTLAPDASDVISHPVTLHDDTLRDGEQTVGVAFSVEEKVELAKLMMEAGFTSFSPGFPAVSEQEREAGRAIRALGGVAAQQFPLCRPLKGDIQAAIDCGFGGIACFIPISDSHVQYKLGITVDAAYAKMLDGIALAVSNGLRVRFGFEDSTRAPLERIKRFVGGAVEAGATGGICLADTVGVLTPLTTHALVREVVRLTGDIPLYVHFHDDLGMATANSIIACVAGARYVCGAFCGLGERAGNVCHEEVAVALRVKYGVDCGVDLPRLVAVARRCSEIARFPIAPNKPILGANAFRHETGIHVHGLTREPSTYEPYPPELIGAHHAISFGKHSGISSVQYLARIAGVEASEAEMTAALHEIKDRGARRAPPTEAQAVEILKRACAAPAGERGRR